MTDHEDRRTYCDDIKMFVFDNDSTLFDHSVGYVREGVFTALEKLKAKGYPLCMNSSRSYAELCNIPQRLLDLMDVLILSNGAYIVYKDRTDVTSIPHDRVKAFIDFMDAHDLTYRYCTPDGGGFINRDDSEKRAIFQRLYGMMPPVKRYDGEEVIQILYYATGEVREELIALADGLECDRMANCGEISPAHKNKGESMIEVGSKMGIAREEICAFGDSGNDIEMMKLAGLGICVGNGTVECKQAADYVCPSVSDEGVYEALKYFGFID